jgi:hypothetical protein
MKKPALTPQEKTRILIACVDLPVVHRVPRFPDYMRDLMATVLDFYMRSEAVIKSIGYFRDHVQNQNNIHTHERLTEIMSGFADTREGDVEASQFLWNNNHWKRARLLRRLLAYLSSIGVTDQVQLHAWARKASFEQDFQGKVPGLGLAVFQWLLIRCGVQTVKPDVWVFRFAQRVLGRKLSDKVTVSLFNELAPLVDTSMIKLDATIWTFERMDMSNRDAPALRIVFWQQLKKRLEERISGDKHLQAGHWQLVLDDQGLLRYDRAGLRMSGRLRLMGEARRMVTQIEVIQSSWQERFGLRFALQRDTVPTDSAWVELQAYLIAEGWVIGEYKSLDAAIAFDTDLLMPPDLSIEALMIRVNDVAERTIRTIEGISVMKAKGSIPEPT